MKILGAVVAGGKSTRMQGGEKAFLSLGGTPLIERVVSRIRFQVNRVVVNANGDPARFAGLDCDIVPDVLAVGTPLAGLHACLSYARAHAYDAVLTVPSDTPFLPLDLVQRLEQAGRATGAAIACSMTRQHYLTGLWSAALAPVLEHFIGAGMRRVQDFVAKLETAEVEWDVLPHDPFLNINTPDDLAFAESHLND